MSDSLQLSTAYSTAANFTYDSSLVEFVASQATLVDQTPANVTFEATYTSSINGNLGDGTLTGTATGGAAVSAAALDLTGGTLKYVSYSATSNAAFTNTGAIRLRYTPNYTGSPAASRGLFSISGTGTQNMIQLNHLSTGYFELSVFSSAGAALINDGSYALWSPTAGTTYEILLVIDITSGATKLFVNGVQKGTTNTATGSRTATSTTLKVGTNYNAAYSPNAKYEDFVVYSVAPYTAAYTPGYTLPESVYSTANPTVEINSGTQMDGITNFIATLTAAGSDTAKFTLLFDGVEYYFPSAVVTASNGTYAQASTEAEIVAAASAITTALASGALVKVKAYLHSEDGSTSPSLTSVVVDYSYFLPETARTRCIVSAYAKDFIDVDATDVVFVVELKKPYFSGNTLVKPGVMEFAVDSAGYFEAQLTASTVEERLYYFSIQYTDNGVSKVKKLGSAYIPAADSATLSSFLTL